nr:hypothetical protein [Candidatus Woesearchaeota archaeon]
MVEKRGQAAMEFLMTYGWAILVVLIAIGALAYFGVLNPERFLPEKCLIASGSGLFCDDYNAVAGSGITVRVRNILTESVTLTEVVVTDPSVTCTWTGSTAITADNTADFLAACVGLTAGQKIKGDITIEYSKAGGLARTTTGNLVTTAA